MNKTKTKDKRTFKKIEHHLRNYRNYQAGIRNLKKQLDFIMPGVTAKYEIIEGSVGAFTFKSTTEDYAIDRIEGKKALTLHEDIAVYQLIIDSIDNALKQLSEKERQFVQLRYIEGVGVEKTAMEMGYTKRNLYFLRMGVKEQLLISLKNIVNLEV